MEIKDPVARLREIAATLDDAAASMSEHGFSIPGIRAKSIADAIEAQYMRLPVDADGVPIRPGDEVCTDSPTRYVVEAVDDGAVVLDDVFMLPADECRHVKPDAVAEELAKFLTACDDDPHYYDEQIEEFAERIRKAVHDG